MFGSATLTIDVSMIAMMTPSITVAVTRATGGSGRTRAVAGVAEVAAPESGRAGAREAMTITPFRVSSEVERE